MFTLENLHRVLCGLLSDLAYRMNSSTLCMLLQGTTDNILDNIGLLHIHGAFVAKSMTIVADDACIIKCTW